MNEGGARVNNALVPGDVEKLEDMMRLYGAAVKRTCLVCLKDGPLAEDAAQDTFVKLYELIRFRKLGAVQNEKAYLLRIAMNCCRDMQRLAWFHLVDRRVTPDELPDPPANTSADTDIWLAVRALPRGLRLCVTLYYQESMTMKEIARTLCCSSASVYRRLKKAEGLLRQALTESAEGEPGYEK